MLIVRSACLGGAEQRVPGIRGRTLGQEVDQQREPE